MSDKLSVSQQNKIMDSSIQTGAPHFRSQYRKYRQSGYQLPASIAEFIDNIILKCTEISVITSIENNKISTIKISDNYINGFEQIHEEGDKNPFNMGHMRDGQDNDDELSQFGVGFKAGAISTALKMTVFTQVNNKFYEIIMDFKEMCNILNPNDSYNPKIYEISEKKYKDNHPFKYGSSIILDNILDTLYKKTTEADLQIYLSNELSNLFGYTIQKNKIEITLNQEPIKPPISYFDLENCKPFNKNISAYKLYNSEKDIEYNIIEINTNSYYINEKGNLEKFKRLTDKQNKITSLFKKGYEYVDCISTEEKAWLKGESTFTYYYDTENTKPNNRIVLYNNEFRSFGNWKIDKGGDNNNLYNDSYVTIKSKKRLKELGLTFNKKIIKGQNNDTSDLLEKIIKKSTYDFNANTSTDQNIKLYKIALENNITVNNSKKPTKFRETEQFVENENVISDTSLEEPKVENENVISDSSLEEPNVENENVISDTSLEEPNVENINNSQTLQSTFSDDQCSEIENHIIEKQTDSDIEQEEEDKSPSSLSLKSYDTENNIQDSSEESIDNFENTVTTHNLNTQTTNEEVNSLKNNNVEKDIEIKIIDNGPKTDTKLDKKNIFITLDNISELLDDSEEFTEKWREKFIELRELFADNIEYGAINKNEMYLIKKLDFVEIINSIKHLYEENYIMDDNRPVKLGAEIKRLYDECKDKIDTCNQ